MVVCRNKKRSGTNYVLSSKTAEYIYLLRRYIICAPHIHS